MKKALMLWAASALLAVSTCVASAQEVVGIDRFEIARFDIEGNTLLPSQVLQDAVTPFVGKERDFGHVQRALEALETRYHQRGFKMVQVLLPEQELNQGVIKLRVVEVKVGKIFVEGNTFFDTANIRNSLPALQENQVPNIVDISASLKTANENPAKKTNLQLQSGDQDDVVNATLKVTDERPWKIGVGIDNTGNKETGRTHVSVSYQHANVLDKDHIASLQYTTSAEKPNKMHVYAAGYHIPLYTLGDSIDLIASYSNVDSGSISIGLLNLLVSGRGSAYGFRYNQNLARIGDIEHKLIYGFDYRTYRNNVNLFGIQLGNDINVHPLSIAYVGTWSRPLSQTNYSITAMHNVPGGSRGRSADFSAVRSSATSSYKLLRINAGHNHLLPDDWRIRMTFNGQFSNDSLISGEQFGAGGATSVRGFPERDISGDSGGAVTAEVQTPNVCATVQSFSAQCRFVGFVDSARVYRNNTLPGEDKHTAIASFGLGAQIAIDKYSSAQIDFAQVINGGGTRITGDKRLHVTVGFSY